MFYFRCCLPGCSSLRRDVSLHKFPKSEKRRQKWLDCIGSASLHKKNSLAHLLVCNKHFERRFMTPKSRLLSSAFPTLFSESEILSGKPQNLKIEEPVHAALDHPYAAKVHLDHTYCKEPLNHSQYVTIKTEPADPEGEQPIQVAKGRRHRKRKFEKFTCHAGAFHKPVHCTSRPVPLATFEPSSHQGLPFSIQGLPYSIQGLPSSIQGLPSSTQGLPSSIQGLPSSIQGLPSAIQELPSLIQSFPYSTQRLQYSIQELPSTIQVPLYEQPFLCSKEAPPSHIESFSLLEEPHLSSQEANFSDTETQNTEKPVIEETKSIHRKGSNKVKKTPLKLLEMRRERRKAMKLFKEKCFEDKIKGMNPLARQIFDMQIKMAKKKRKARRFTLEEKMLALAILKQGMKSYKFLQTIFILPSLTTLKKVVIQLKLECGINPQVFESGAQEVDQTLTEEDAAVSSMLADTFNCQIDTGLTNSWKL